MPVDRDTTKTWSSRLKIPAFLLFMFLFGGVMYLAGHEDLLDQLTAPSESSPSHEPQKAIAPSKAVKNNPKKKRTSLKPPVEQAAYTFFETLDDPEMQAYVGLDGTVVNGEQVMKVSKEVPSEKPVKVRSLPTKISKTESLVQKITETPKPEARVAPPAKKKSLEEQLAELEHLQNLTVKEKSGPDSGKSSIAEQGKGAFWLQVSSFREKERSDALVADLVKKGYPAFSKKMEVPGKGVWFRVYLGQFSSRDGAEKARDAAVRRHSLKTMVIQAG